MSSSISTDNIRRS